MAPSVWYVTDLIALPCLIVCLLSCIFSLNVSARFPPSRFLLGAACFLTLLVLGNQHRLQPWVYHFLLTAWTLLLLPRAMAVRWLLLLLASVYFYSAWNKFDRRFLETTGGMMIRTLVQWWDADARMRPAGDFANAAILLPLGELFTAFAILSPRTRWMGRMMAMGLHAGLLLILGPWGLQHRWGVLVWNVAFLTQCLYLTGRFSTVRAADSQLEKMDDAPRRSTGNVSVRQSIAMAPLLVAMIAPALEPWGWWDHWTSWGLYSARATKIDVYVDDTLVARLPDEWQPYCEKVSQSTFWHRIALDRWSLNTLETPIYPQARFHWGVFRAMLRQIGPETADSWMVVESASPDRRSGRAKQETWVGKSRLDAATQRFWINTQPR